MKYLILLLLIFSVAGFSCSNSNQPSKEMQKKTAKDIIDEYSPKLMAIDGVVGISEGQLENGNTCIIVMVKETTAEVKAKVPSEIEGYPVVVEETGELRPM